MLWAACRSSLLGFAKGHVHRLSVRCRFTKVSSATELRNTRWLKTSTTHTCAPAGLTSSSDVTPSRRQKCEHHYSLHVHLLNSRVLASGLCSKASGNAVSPQDRREDEGLSSSSSSPNNGGHFQFKELYENPWTIPNYLCMARIVLSPLLGYLIVEQHFHASLGLFVLAGATDLLDGYIARNWPNQKSALGSALDPLADKILISVLYVSLTYAHIIPAALTALVICRDVALIAAVFYVRYKTVPAPDTKS